MDIIKDPHQLIQELIDLQNAYAKTYRAMVTGERLNHGLKNDEEIDVVSERLREPLLEHVGHLPMIASFLYPYIENKGKVDLGRTLIMLSIHDIGETVVGDMLSFKKTAEHASNERLAALDILPEELVPYYEEHEAGESFDAKFAKAIDTIAPFLHELSMPNLTRTRFAVHGFDSEKIEKKKRPLFLWDSVLLGIFERSLDAFRQIERGEPTGFVTTVDLK
ncbi:HD domain-containing protein [Candidatus Falkowbacteria bacterium]|nr:HD domain-containing protein [Candidatus Falkowbacteria bacterium]